MFLLSVLHTARKRPGWLAWGRVDAAVLQYRLARCPCISWPPLLILVEEGRVLSALSNTDMQ